MRIEFPQKLVNRHGENLDFIVDLPQDSTHCDKLVLLGHGVTGNKDRPILQGVSRSLVKAGYAVLRFSFAGNGASEGKFEQATITKEVEDLLDLLDQLSFGRKLAYVGHSQGGAVGVLTAARDERIQALVSLAGMVDTKAFFQREFGQQVAGKDLLWDEEGFPLSIEYKEDMQEEGRVELAAAAVCVPWLLLHGTEDDVVLLEDSHQAKQQATSCKKLELKEIDGADHVFSSSEEEVGTRIATWLDQNWK